MGTVMTDITWGLFELSSGTVSVYPSDIPIEHGEVLIQGGFATEYEAHRYWMDNF